MRNGELLVDVLENDEIRRVREETLAAGLMAVRARRRFRRLVDGVLATVACASISLAVLWTLGNESGFHAAEKWQASADRPGFRIIDSEEFLAIVSDRPVAIIGSGPNRRVIFPDESLR